MPKIQFSSFPLSGLFGVSKPSGPTSMSIINDIKPLVAQSRIFVEVDKSAKTQARRGKYGRGTIKIGQGGTLDPLADGVLVVGIGKGTKKLSGFLDCTKEYYTTCLLGCETDTYDSEGKRVRTAPWRHVTREHVEMVLPEFTGGITQTPPIFSALKMDGMPLYEYARKGIPLPRPIESRKVTVHALEIMEWKGSDHPYRWPSKSFTEGERKALEIALKGTADDISGNESSAEDAIPTAFVLKMKVSGGTYVRSIVHDLAHKLGSAGHVVTLTRSRQGHFTLQPSEAGDLGCVPWDVFQRATANAGPADEDGWTEWEREVIDKIEATDG